MQATDTIVSTALTGATVRCIATPEIRAYEEARLSGAPREELQRLRQIARQNHGHADETEDGARRQGTAGQVAGMITRIRPAAEIIEGMIQDAAALSASLAELAQAPTPTAGRAAN
jgi:NAD(P)H-dependent flavin oxidoreductase YrpB (nitropropane dioxygenase family)